jgi:hypothetical protein
MSSRHDRAREREIARNQRANERNARVVAAREAAQMRAADRQRAREDRKLKRTQKAVGRHNVETSAVLEEEAFVGRQANGVHNVSSVSVPADSDEIADLGSLFTVAEVGESAVPVDDPVRFDVGSAVPVAQDDLFQPFSASVPEGVDVPRFETLPHPSGPPSGLAFPVPLPPPVAGSWNVGAVSGAGVREGQQQLPVVPRVPSTQDAASDDAVVAPLDEWAWLREPEGSPSLLSSGQVGDVVLPSSDGEPGSSVVHSESLREADDLFDLPDPAGFGNLSWLSAPPVDELPTPDTVHVPVAEDVAPSSFGDDPTFDVVEFGNLSWLSAPPVDKLPTVLTSVSTSPADLDPVSPLSDSSVHVELPVVPAELFQSSSNGWKTVADIPAPPTDPVSTSLPAVDPVLGDLDPAPFELSWLATGDVPPAPSTSDVGLFEGDGQVVEPSSRFTADVHGNLSSVPTELSPSSSNGWKTVADMPALPVAAEDVQLTVAQVPVGAVAEQVVVGFEEPGVGVLPSPSEAVEQLDVAMPSDPAEFGDLSWLSSLTPVDELPTPNAVHVPVAEDVAPSSFGDDPTFDVAGFGDLSWLSAPPVDELPTVLPTPNAVHVPVAEDVAPSSFGDDPTFDVAGFGDLSWLSAPPVDELPTVLPTPNAVHVPVADGVAPSSFGDDPTFDVAGFGDLSWLSAPPVDELPTTLTAVDPVLVEPEFGPFELLWLATDDVTPTQVGQGERVEVEEPWVDTLPSVERVETQPSLDPAGFGDLSWLSAPPVDELPTVLPTPNAVHVPVADGVAPSSFGDDQTFDPVEFGDLSWLSSLTPVDELPTSLPAVDPVLGDLDPAPFELSWLATGDVPPAPSTSDVGLFEGDGQVVEPSSRFTADVHGNLSSVPTELSPSSSNGWKTVADMPALPVAAEDVQLSLSDLHANTLTTPTSSDLVDEPSDWRRPLDVSATESNLSDIPDTVTVSGLEQVETASSEPSDSVQHLRWEAATRAAPADSTDSAPAVDVDVAADMPASSSIDTTDPLHMLDMMLSGQPPAADAVTADDAETDYWKKLFDSLDTSSTVPASQVEQDAVPAWQVMATEDIRDDVTMSFASDEDGTVVGGSEELVQPLAEVAEPVAATSLDVPSSSRNRRASRQPRPSRQSRSRKAEKRVGAAGRNGPAAKKQASEARARRVEARAATAAAKAEQQAQRNAARLEAAAQKARLLSAKAAAKDATKLAKAAEKEQQRLVQEQARAERLAVKEAEATRRLEEQSAKQFAALAEKREREAKKNAAREAKRAAAELKRKKRPAKAAKQKPEMSEEKLEQARRGAVRVNARRVKLAQRAAEQERREAERAAENDSKLSYKDEARAQKMEKREQARTAKEQERARKREVKAALEAQREAVKLAKMRSEESSIREQARRRALRDDVKVSKNAARDKDRTLKRAAKLGLDVSGTDFDETIASEITPIPVGVSGDLFDWRSADLPEPIPSR